MSDLVKTLLDFVERFPTLAWRMGLSCAGLGFAVYGAIWWGFVRPEAFSGYAADGARLAIAFGAGFFIIGTIFAIAGSAARILAWMRRRKQRITRKDMLLQNMRFLTPPAQLILYIALTEPQGRFASFGDIPPMRLLRQYEIVEGGAYSLKQGHIIQVAPELYAVRDAVSAALRKNVEGSLNLSLEDVEAVSAKLKEILKAEPNWWA